MSGFEDILETLGALTDIVGMKTCLWSELESKQRPRQICNKKYKSEKYGLRTFGKDGCYIWRETES